MRPGPRPGHGGRPRTKHPKPRSDGYSRTTVGPKGHGTLQYVHRVTAYGGRVGGRRKAPKSSYGTRKVVDHRNRVRTNNSRGNVHIVSRSVNNRNRSRSKRY